VQYGKSGEILSLWCTNHEQARESVMSVIRFSVQFQCSAVINGVAAEEQEKRKLISKA
jgi:hypothetical protein